MTYNSAKRHTLAYKSQGFRRLLHAEPNPSLLQAHAPKQILKGKNTLPSISENNKLTKPPQRQAKIVGEIVRRIDAYNPDWASNTAELLLAHGRGKIDALIIEDDNVVPAATEGIAASGVHVPEDVLVIAHTNFPHITQSVVPAVRVGMNVRDAMHLAVTLIEKQRMGEEVPKNVTLPSVMSEDDLQ